MEVVDYVSIGTDDLGRRTMAADPMAGALGDLIDPWQPALLDLVALVGEDGRLRGRPVGVCGEAAADPQLGVGSLSTAPAARPAVHAQLAWLGAAGCAEPAEIARASGCAGSARAAVQREVR